MKYPYTTCTALLLTWNLFTTALQGQALIDATLVSEVSRAELSVTTGFPAFFDVEAYRVEYQTIGIDGQPDTATGLIALPVATAHKGIIAYQHGTTDRRENVPSNLNAEALIPLTAAGQGYICSAADYLGLGGSRGFHPYVHAETEARAGVDLLIAAMGFAVEQGLESVRQVFVAGYSQGGHAAMAMAQAIQERPTDDLWLTAAAPMSGPYSISGVMRDSILVGTQEYTFPAYIVYNILGYQSAYGTLYDSLEQVFRPSYVPKIREFNNEELDLGSLNTFLLAELRSDGGTSLPRNMLQEEYLAAIVTDSLHPANVALRDNDTYLWVPEVPMRIYYCNGDEQVPFRNSLVAEAYMQGQGAGDVQAISLSPTASHGECVLPAVLASLAFFNTFQTTGVTERLPVQSLTIMPNPARHRIEVDLPFQGAHPTFSIFDLQARLILSGEMKGRSLNIETLPMGLYTLKIVMGSDLYVGKFLVR